MRERRTLPQPNMLFLFIDLETVEAQLEEPVAEITTTAGGAEGAGSSSDMIEWFTSTIKDYDATFIVYYRGLW